MSSREIEQLVEMGATRAQARAAMRQCRDVMDAAEKIFEGKFDHVTNEEDLRMEVPREVSKKPARMVTPDEEDGGHEGVNDGAEDDDDGYIFIAGGEYCDYDSDYDQKAEQSRTIIPDVDPYAGIFFSKDRKEEVIEIEEEPEMAWIPELSENVKLMTQGEWMKGCPEGGEQGFLFSLYSQLSSEPCVCPHQCGGSAVRRKSDFFAIISEFSTYVNRLRTIVRHKCSTCSREFCLACGEPFLVSGNLSRTSGPTNGDPLFHCSDIQGLILGVGLSMLQQMFADQSQSSPLSNPEERTKKKRKVELAPTVDPNEDDEDEGYFPPGAHRSGKKAKGGTGYAGAVREDTTGQTEAAAVQKAKDEKMGKLLSDIRVFLPSVQREGGGQTSDYLVHPTTLAHLRRRFNLVSSSLLRNDSLTDMSDRAVLYFELFEWLETISNHEALASMMAMPIMVISSIKSVVAKRAPGGSRPTTRERTIIYEGSSGPRELMEAIVIQAQAALKGLEGMVKASQEVDPEEMTEEQKRMTTTADKGKGKEKDVVQTDENLRLLKFCQRILATANAIDRSLRETKGDAFVDRLHASLPKIPRLLDQYTQVSLQAGYSEEDARKAYTSWASRTRFEYCDLSIEPVGKKNESGEDATPNYKFYFNNDARILANSDIPKRSLAIAKELAVLTTNLPVDWGSSVFLRVDETRVDIIKALITGPEGTPYHNGCYLFDIFLGPTYNQSPPSVKYMTTNGGKFRFNPNLYADGKVCLSLLGTWSGPGWIAGKSTLLQVLISIQSMILCEEPYLNEPGWASQGGTPQSKAYSANVRRMVVNTAMLGNLKNPPEPFAEVIRTHFRLKARSIMKQLDQWLALDDGNTTNGAGSGYQDAPVAAVGPVATLAAAMGLGGGSRNPFQKDVEELKGMLLALEKGSMQSTDSMDIEA